MIPPALPTMNLFFPRRLTPPDYIRPGTLFTTYGRMLFQPALQMSPNPNAIQQQIPYRQNPGIIQRTTDDTFIVTGAYLILTNTTTMPDEGWPRNASLANLTNLTITMINMVMTTACGRLAKHSMVTCWQQSTNRL